MQLRQIMNTAIKNKNPTAASEGLEAKAGTRKSTLNIHWKE